MKTTKQSIDAFFAIQTIAMAGVSRDPKKFGHQIFVQLKEKGYSVLPVHPVADRIGEVPCYPRVSSLPEGVRSLFIATPKDKTNAIVTEAIEHRIDNIWVQQMSSTPETIKIAEGKPVNLICGECLLMFLEPVKGIHKFHRAIKGFFGKLPK